MTDEQRTGPLHEGRAGDFIERRREERFRVPPVYKRYITLRVKSGVEVVPCVLTDFSRSGILFISPAAFSADSHAECIISMPKLLTKEIVFDVRIKHCTAKEGSFFVGASIETVADGIGFEVFAEVHDYIVERQDEVY